MIETLEHLDTRVLITARARAETGTCPHCARPSATVHGRYRRRVLDAAVGGHPLIVDLQVRRWRCRNRDCVTVTFAEQTPGLTSPHARYTPFATEMIEAIGLALAGRAGARLAARPGMAVGRDTLLRRVRALADPATATRPITRSAPEPNFMIDDIDEWSIVPDATNLSSSLCVGKEYARDRIVCGMSG